MRIFFIAAPLFLIFSSGQAQSSPANTSNSAESKYYYICRQDKVVRSLRVESQPEKCNAIYTKNGQDQIIGSAMKMPICVDVLEKVKDTLTGAGWKCKQVKDGNVSHLGDSSASSPGTPTSPSENKKEKSSGGL